MTEPTKKKKRIVRPLLVASAGIAVLTAIAVSASSCGNLMPRVRVNCPEGQDDFGSGCETINTPDGGTDGGTP